MMVLERSVYCSPGPITLSTAVVGGLRLDTHTSLQGNKVMQTVIAMTYETDYHSRYTCNIPKD
jgi:hypothetical protein